MNTKSIRCTLAKGGEIVLTFSKSGVIEYTNTKGNRYQFGTWSKDEHGYNYKPSKFPYSKPFYYSGSGLFVRSVARAAVATYGN